MSNDQIVVEVERAADQIERELGHLDREQRIALERELFALVNVTERHVNDGSFW
jgi:hypothetical protein